MSYQAALELLFPDRPFFWGATEGPQTHVVHHLAMIALVAMLAEHGRPVRVLEVGSWIGFSALTWCHAVDAFSREPGSVLCVDSWEPYFRQDDLGKGAGAYSNMERMSRLGLSYDLFLHNMKFRAKRVQWDHMRGKSDSVLSYLRPDSFDVVYLDGSHYYEDVRRDIGNAEPLVKDGGILCGDDLNVQLHELDEKLVRAKLNQDCYVDEQSRVFFHPGVTLAVGERFGPVSEWGGMWAVRKTGGAYQKVEPKTVPANIPPHFSPEQRKEAERLLGIKPP